MFAASMVIHTFRCPLRAGQVLLTALLLLLASSAIAAAQAPQPVLSPAQVTIAGESGTLQQRTFLLQLPPDASDVRFVAQDLLTPDGTGVLPASAIRADIPVASAQPSTAVTGSVTLPLNMALTVDLSEVDSGAYAGDALVYYALPGSTEALTPVRLTAESLGLTVNVKSPPWWPAIVLALGLLLGIGLTTYREQLAPVDRLLVRLAAIQNRLEGDAELGTQGAGAAFRELADRALTDALTLLRAGDQQNAARLAQRAETIVNLWARERERWLRAIEMQRGLLEQIDELHTKLTDEALAPARAHLAKVHSAVEAVVATVVEDLLADANKGDSAHADKLVKCLDEQRSKLRTFASFADKLSQIANKLAHANSEQQKQFKALVTDVGALDADAALAAYTSQVTALDERATALLDAILAPKTREEALAQAVPAVDRAALSDDLFTVLLYAGMLPTTPEDLKHNRASLWRLRTLTWLSWAVALLLLGGVGFNELYVSKATFGATPWTDYPGLFAWGFGVEVTRNAVVQMVQGWGIPAKSPTST